MSNRMRATRSKTAKRRSHHKMEAPATTVGQDGVRHFKHRASSQTGKYRDRQVIDVTKHIDKKQKKQATLQEGDTSE